MAIGTAVQKGSMVYLYNEKGTLITSVPCGSGPEDGLEGYTSTLVSVRRGSMIYTYNERGTQVSSMPAR